MEQMKRCTKCGTQKPATEFYDRGGGRLGKMAQCKECIREKSRTYREKNLEAARERSRQYRRKHLQEEREKSRRAYYKNREDRLARVKWYYQAHKVEKATYDKAYRDAYQKQVAQRQHEWYLQNADRIAQENQERRRQFPEWRRLSNARMKKARRRRKKNAQGSHDHLEFIALCEYYGNRCLCCGKEKNLTEDHIIPLSKNGTDYISNIQPLCRSCNARKHTRIIDFRPEMKDRLLG